MISIAPQIIVGSIFVLFAVASVVSAQQDPIVETSLGKIRGTILKTEKGSDFYAFRGIKYAEAPIEEKRFKAPIAISTPWTGEYDATQDGPMCPQVGPPVDLISEDCLLVNVYSKNLTGKRPVIVYIHGGANKEGGSHSYREAGPQYLMESDIVLVSLNYRLGALGFMSTRTAEASGNFGYLDQVMALQWVQQHIENFGGNSSSVTLMGFSAGGRAVSIHLVSPLSRGLFNRIIAMSGSSINEQAVDNLHWATRLAHETSCPMYNSANLVSCLRKVPWQSLVEVSKRWDLYNFTDLKWVYEVDGHFLEMRPSEYLAKGNFSKVPILTGITRDELSFMADVHENNTVLLNDIDSNFDKYSREFFMHDFGDPAQKKAEQLKAFYFKNESISKDNVGRLGEALSDAVTVYGVHRLVDLARKFVDVFYYRFDYHGRIGLRPYIYHSVDQFYIFKINKFGIDLIGVNDPEWAMVETMVDIITTFAETGAPPELGTVKWQPSNKTDINTLYINEPFKMDGEPYQERFQLWDRLFPAPNIGTQSVCLTITLFVVAALLHVFI